MLWRIYGHFAGTPFIQPRLPTSEYQGRHGCQADASASAATPTATTLPAHAQARRQAKEPKRKKLCTEMPPSHGHCPSAAVQSPEPRPASATPWWHTLRAAAALRLSEARSAEPCIVH